jgi:pentalenene oxygenase
MTRLSIPEAPGAWPVLGHLVPAARGPLSFFGSLAAHGDLLTLRFGRVQAIVVCTPELIQKVLIDDRVFDKGGPVLERTKEILGDSSLGRCPHREHRRLRRLVQPAFHPHRLPGYSTIMARQIMTVTERWRPGQHLDVLAEMQELTTRVAVATMFTDALDEQALVQATKDLTCVVRGVLPRLIVPRVVRDLPIPATRRYHRARARLRETVRALMANRRTAAGDHGDLLSALLAARDSDEAAGAGQLSDDEVTDQAITFFIAGSETCASTLAWALHLVARHPDIRRRLHAEVDGVLDGAPVGLDHLPRLELTARIITETLRLYPPAWVTTRTVTADAQLAGYDLPAGATVVVSPYVIHRRADLYPRPDRFDPDRAAPSRGAYLPFGGGARKCIGDQFGVTEATLALAAIAARWGLEPVPGRRPVRPATAMALYPHGLRMLVRERSGGAEHV